MSRSNGCFLLFSTRYNLLCVLSDHCTENGVGEDELLFENYPHTVMILDTTSHFDPPRYNDDSDVDMSRDAEIPVARSSWRLDCVWRRPSICGFSVWNLVPVTLLAPRISR